MKSVFRSLMAIAFGALAAALSGCGGTVIGNPPSPSVTLSLGQNTNSGITAFTVCPVTVRVFKSGAQVSSTALAPTELSLTSTDQVLATLQLPAQSYESVELDLGASCASGYSVQLTNSVTTLVATDSITLRFTGTISVGSSSGVVKLDPQPILDKLVSVTAPADIKTNAESVSGGVNSSWTYLGVLPSFGLKPDIIVDSSGAPIVGYWDGNHGGKASVQKWTGSSWSFIGADGFTPAGADEVSLAMAASGEMYIAFKDYSVSQRLSVMKWDGVTWSYVGSPGFSVAGVSTARIGVDPLGVPYVAYQDNDSAAFFGITVQKWNGVSWALVGTRGFTTTGSYYTSLAIDSTGTPAVGFICNACSSKAEMVKWNGTTWDFIGGSYSTGISSGIAFATSLIFGPSNTPYVAYSDNTDSQKVYVKRWDGVSNWTVVGSGAVSSASAVKTTLRADSSGNLYVSYFEAGTPTYKLKVMKWDGSLWAPIGSADSFGYANEPKLAVSALGVPYVAYEDSQVGLVVRRFDSAAP